MAALAEIGHTFDYLFHTGHLPLLSLISLVI
jgi:hypothetical protein